MILTLLRRRRSSPPVRHSRLWSCARSKLWPGSGSTNWRPLSGCASAARAGFMCCRRLTSSQAAKGLGIAPGCSSMAAKIRPQGRRQAALSVTWSSAGPCPQAREFTCARGSKSAERATCFFLPGSNRRGSRMCGLRAAPFLGQKVGFSCHNAHSFNRNSSMQVEAYVACS